MKYEEPSMQILIWDYNVAPMTTVISGDPFKDWEDGSDMPIE